METKDKKARRPYTIECTEEQLWLIAKAVEDYTRFLAGQCGMNNAYGFATPGVLDYQRHKEFDNIAHSIMAPELAPGSGYSWNGGGCDNPLQRKEIAMGYGIYRQIRHYFAMQLEDNDWNVYKSETLTCPEQGPLITIKEKED